MVKHIFRSSKKGLFISDMTNNIETVLVYTDYTLKLYKHANFKTS